MLGSGVVGIMYSAYSLSQLSGLLPLAASSKAAEMAVEMSSEVYLVPPQLVPPGTPLCAMAVDDARAIAATIIERTCIVEVVETGRGEENV